jgi:alcohol dehydrogenase YqhD (iron-dependent ADH family)
MIEHSLSAIYNVPHGAGLAVVLPAWMKYSCKNSKNPQFERFAKKIFSKDSSKEGINAFEKWLQKIGAPTTLRELGISSEDIEKIAQNVDFVSHRWSLKQKYPCESIKEILKTAK